MVAAQMHAVVGVLWLIVGVSLSLRSAVPVLINYGP